MKLITLTGMKFGKLTVLKLSSDRMGEKVMWDCICDCGNTITCTAGNLRTKGSQSCGCKRSDTHINRNPDREKVIKKNIYLRHVKLTGRKASQNCTLLFEDFCELISQNCHYCGNPPSAVAKDKKHGRILTDVLVYYNGVDRLDSKLPYSKENCVPCCKHCNYAKGQMTVEEFELWLYRTYHHTANKKRQQVAYASMFR